jgi:hypothetical protein
MIKNSQKIFVIAIIIITGIAFIYLSNTGNENGDAEKNSGDLPDNKTETEAIVLPIIDGLVEKEEYSNLVYDASTGISVGWTNNEDSIYIALISPGKGWVSIGIDPNSAMRDANFIIGYYDEGVYISDEYGTSNFVHNPDKNLGGTDDILEYAGSETDQTVLEFRLPLDSGDNYDKSLKSGNTYDCIIAYNNNADNFTTKHTRIGNIQITIE